MFCSAISPHFFRNEYLRIRTRCLRFLVAPGCLFKIRAILRVTTRLYDGYRRKGPPLRAVRVQYTITYHIHARICKVPEAGVENGMMPHNRRSLML